MLRPPPRPTLFPYTTLFRSNPSIGLLATAFFLFGILPAKYPKRPAFTPSFMAVAIMTGSLAPETAVFNKTASAPSSIARSEEHTSELQSRGHLVCRLLLEKKK